MIVYPNSISRDRRMVVRAENQAARADVLHLAIGWLADSGIESEVGADHFGAVAVGQRPGQEGPAGWRAARPEVPGRGICARSWTSTPRITTGTAHDNSITDPATPLGVPSKRGYFDLADRACPRLISAM